MSFNNFNSDGTIDHIYVYTDKDLTRQHCPELNLHVSDPTDCINQKIIDEVQSTTIATVAWDNLHWTNARIDGYDSVDFMQFVMAKYLVENVKKVDSFLEMGFGPAVGNRSGFLSLVAALIIGAPEITLTCGDYNLLDLTATNFLIEGESYGVFHGNNGDGTFAMQIGEQCDIEFRKGAFNFFGEYELIVATLDHPDPTSNVYNWVLGEEHKTQKLNYFEIMGEAAKRANGRFLITHPNSQDYLLEQAAEKLGCELKFHDSHEIWPTEIDVATGHTIDGIWYRVSEMMFN